MLAICLAEESIGEGKKEKAFDPNYAGNNPLDLKLGEFTSYMVPQIISTPNLLNPDSKRIFSQELLSLYFIKIGQADQEF